jgi:DNA-directed RNA polymerases I, II, and III subunit RPABC2
MTDKKYEDYESSYGGSDSDTDNDNDLKYISKVKKATGVAQVGGVGDYDDDDMEEIGDEDEDGDEESWESESNDDDELFEKKPSAQFIGDEDEEDLELSDEDDDEDDEETKLQKFNNEVRKNVITEHHPELLIHNYHEVEAMCNIVRNERGIIIDPLHKTLPFITKYEKAKILGERAKQINAGAMPFVVVSDEILDGYVIAQMEFEQKKIPMIIRRPLPNNGCEYWRVADLENII